MSVLFVAKAKLSQSADNTKAIFTDGSNYATNTEGISLASIASRSVAIKDSLGAAVATVPMTLQDDGSYAGNWSVAKDFAYSYILTLTLTNATTKVGTTTYVLIGYYNEAFMKVMENKLGDCNCKGSVCSDLTWSMHNKNAAILFASKGLLVLAQASIDAANAFVNNILNG